MGICISKDMDSVALAASSPFQNRADGCVRVVRHSKIFLHLDASKRPCTWLVGVSIPGGIISDGCC